ncbi:hypothetical protein GF373_09820 [bacterium]|nr:hypothetical protein [bacterium]
MQEYAKKVLRITAGIVCLIIGAIGGLIPILQGWVFGLLGLWLLSKDVPFVRKYYIKAEAWVKKKKEERQQQKEAKKEAAQEKSID